MTLEATHRAAGILFRTPDGQALFLKRGPGGDYPGYWCFPGGHLEDGESAEAAALREANEEIGFVPDGSNKLEVLARSISAQELPPALHGGPEGPGATGGEALRAPVAPKVVDFTTFSAVVPDRFDVASDAEHVGFAWAPLLEPPEPLHPGCRVAIERLFADELGVARMIADGRLTSPQRYRNVTLWAMRITGTGVSYRTPVFKTDAKGKVVLGEDRKPVVEREEEFPFRDPAIYLNDEFLARCNGLPVIWKHPKKQVLDSKEFESRVVGMVFLPFIRGDEVWGVAKVYDDEANAVLAAGTEDGKGWSTSPAVVLSDPAHPSYKFRLEDGSVLLVEGKPSLLDHLAICERGVWDKGGEPAGILNEERNEMADEKKEDVKADSAKEPTMTELMAAIGGVAQQVSAIGARVDSLEVRADSEKDEDDKKSDADEDKKSDEDKDDKKSDADEDKKSDEDKDDKKSDADGCAEKMVADARADAAAARADAAKLASRLEALESRIPKEREESDYRAMSSAQSRADSVYEMHGQQAPRFLSGEALRDYRNRLVRKFQELSPTWKAVDVGALADEAFEIAETAIYADAAAAAKSAVGVEDGGLRMVPGRTPAGHATVEFHGRPGAWLGHFGGARRYATRISPNTSRSREVH